MGNYDLDPEYPTDCAVALPVVCVAFTTDVFGLLCHRSVPEINTEGYMETRVPNDIWTVSHKNGLKIAGGFVSREKCREYAEKIRDFADWSADDPIKDYGGDDVKALYDKLTAAWEEVITTQIDLEKIHDFLWTFIQELQSSET